MAEGVELDSKLSANSSVLQHLGDGDASGAQDDDDDGSGDPEVIISNPGRGGDVAVATAAQSRLAHSLRGWIRSTPRFLKTHWDILKIGNP